MIETTILTNLINNEEYIRKVLPYVKDEYFQDHVDRSIYNEIVGYFEKYNKMLVIFQKISIVKLVLPFLIWGVLLMIILNGF